MTRDEIADAWLLSNFNTPGIEQEPQYHGQCTPQEYISNIREYKPFALHKAYQVADFCLLVSSDAGLAK